MTKDALRRQKENAELMERMKRGDNLCHTGLQSYRWAPRPMVKKDQKEIDRLYGSSKPALGLVEGEAHGD